MANSVRALVVDDSALYRKFVSSALNDIPGVDVVGTASNGRTGLERIEQLKPDLITLDQEMPELDGLGMLGELSARDLKIATIMISSHTEDGAKTTSAALQLGAFDFVLKPTGKGPEESRKQLTADLTPKIEAYLASQRRKPAATPNRSPLISPESDNAIARMKSTIGQIKKTPHIVCIGVSTGGPAALNRLLPKLPGSFPCPIVLVQHMPPKFTKSLADDLNRLCELEVQEAAEGMVAKPGQVLIAPGGSQMRITKLNQNTIVQITDDPPERNCKPAVDYLFRSVASCYGDRALGVILTGMGDDGTVGCKLLKDAGARIFTQDEPSCVVYGMPRAVDEAGLSDQSADLLGIADLLTEAVGAGATL